MTTENEGFAPGESDAVGERLQIIAATMFLLSGTRKRGGRRQRKLVIKRNPGTGRMEIPDCTSPFVAGGRNPWVFGEERADTQYGPMIEAVEWLHREMGIRWIRVRESGGFLSFAAREPKWHAEVSRPGESEPVMFRDIEIGERQFRKIIDAWHGRFGFFSADLMTGEMSAAFSCAKARAKHPGLKPENVRRLIDAIGGSVPRSMAQQRPLFAEGGRPLDRKETMRRNVAIGADAADSGSIPVCFDLGTWIDYVGSRGFSRHSCGTAACISGFAHIMLEGDRGESVRCGDELRQQGAIKSLMEFVGVKRSVAFAIANCMTADRNEAVQPRHAVALLERLLDTGDVDWHRAMGRVKNRLGRGSEMTKRERALRARERALVEEAAGAIGNPA